MRETPRANQTFKVLDKKRTAVLNNLYMHNVTEALSFGGFSEIADKGIQITNVWLLFIFLCEFAHLFYFII